MGSGLNCVGAGANIDVRVQNFCKITFTAL